MGNIRIQHWKKWALICTLTMLLAGIFPIRISAYSCDASQVIFLLDGSGSMAGKRWQEAVDSLMMVTAMLPSSYQTAAVAYNQDIIISTDFRQALKEQIHGLQRVKPEGYTNTGLALETALEMFSDDVIGEKRIVIITDGEISMKGQQETEDALALYDAAVRKALDQGVKIDLLLLEDDGIEEQIGYGTEMTGGFIFRKAEEDSVGRFAESYLFEQLGLERIMVGTSDASGNTADIFLGDSCMEHARILIIADSIMADVQAACQSRNVLVTQGEKFAVIDIEKPMDANVRLQYTLSEKGKVNLYLIKEYSLTVDVEASYVEEFSQHLIRVHITNPEGNSIFTGDHADEKVEIYVNGNKTSYSVEQDAAEIPYLAEKSGDVIVRVDFQKMSSIVFSSEEECSLYLELSPQPEEEQDDDYEYIWVYAIAAGVSIIFILLLILLLVAKKKTKNTRRRPKGKMALMRY